MNEILQVTQTHSLRAQYLRIILEDMRKQTVPTDLCVWDNGSGVFVPDDVLVFRSPNTGSFDIKRWLPPLTTGHKYLFYRDDDFEAGSRFLEVAIPFLEKNPEAIVVSGGSLVHNGDIPNREFFWGIDRKNAEPMTLDFGSTTCVVVRTDRIPFLLTMAVEPIKYYEVAVSILQKLYFGKIWMLPHTDPETCGIKSFYPWSWANAVSANKNFVADRTKDILYLMNKYKDNLPV